MCHNVRLADMNVDVPIADARRMEVVAHCLSLWNGAHLAADATIAPSPAGGRRSRAADVPARLPRPA